MLSTFLASSVLLAIACGGDDSLAPTYTDDAGSGDAAIAHDATTSDASTCGGGTIECGGACIDEKVDPSNCGACGKVCAKGELCSAGTCATSCGAGLTECGGDAGVDLCISTKTDNANCGACGNACPSGTACTNGACELSCQSGLSACPITVATATPDGGAPDASADGGTTTRMVCTDLDGDSASCGGCGNVCASGTVCRAGKCEVTCGTGKTRCDSDAGATCVDEQSDNANCGGCDVRCGVGEACSSGICATTCGGALTKCTTKSGSTCNDLSSDPDNCGACGNSCARGEACSGGVCGTFCNDKVLFLGDQDGTTDANLVAALEAYGLDVTFVFNGSATYDGVTPPLGTFGAVYVDADSYVYDTPTMPTAGQQALLDAFNAGTTGVVLAGSMNINVSKTHDPVIAPLILFGGDGDETSATVTATAPHPIWNGLPSSFANGGNGLLLCFDGCTTPSGATNIAQLSASGGDVVSVLDGPGRSVSFGWIVFGEIDWASGQPNMTHAIANSLKWAARCNVPSK